MPTNLRNGLIFAAQLAAIVAVSWAGLTALRALFLEDAHPVWISQLMSASGGTLCFVGAAILVPARGTRETRRLMQAMLVSWGLVFWTQGILWLRPGNLDSEDLLAVQAGFLALMMTLGLTAALGARMQLTGRRLALLFVVLALVAALAWYVVFRA